MKYCAIDLETTGLNSWSCDILEVGAVIADTNAEKTPLEMLPVFHCYFVQDTYQGDPFALAMNAEILKKIAVYMKDQKVAEKMDPNDYFIELEDFPDIFARWLTANGIDSHKVVAAGKNFANFDKRFLDNIPGLSDCVTFHHRTLDPGILFMRPTDDLVPDLKTCLLRAGLPDRVSHRAVDDALCVVSLLRAHFSKYPWSETIKVRP